MGMTHPAIVDDDFSLTIGTTWNNAWEALHDTAIDAAIAGALTPSTSAPTTTGNQTALALPSSGSGPLVTHFNNATLTTIQGMAAGTHGQIWFQFSKGAGQVDYAHLHASGTALGKLKLFATSGLTSLAAGVGVAVFQYDATVTQWRLVDHEQGAWITAPYVAGNFTGSGAMTWTVDAGDVGACAYWLKGRTLTVAVTLNTTTVGGTLSNALNIGNGAWGGFVAAATVTTATGWLYDGATTFAGYLTSFVGQGNLQVVKLSGANWIAATNLTYVWATLAFPVT